MLNDGDALGVPAADGDVLPVVVAERDVLPDPVEDGVRVWLEELVGVGLAAQANC